MDEKEYNIPVTFELIQMAMKGDINSINQIVSYFQPYIDAKSKRKFLNEFGSVEYVIDEYMKRRVETKLITKILDFKIRI